MFGIVQWQAGIRLSHVSCDQARVWLFNQVASLCYTNLLLRHKLLAFRQRTIFLTLHSLPNFIFAKISPQDPLLIRVASKSLCDRRNQVRKKSLILTIDLRRSEEGALKWAKTPIETEMTDNYSSA